jgi:hypothetical protein
MRLLDRVDRDRQRLTEHPLLDGNPAVRRQTAFLGHYDVLRQAPVALTGRAEKTQIEAGVLATGLALRAAVTGHRRLDHHLLSTLRP